MTGKTENRSTKHITKDNWFKILVNIIHSEVFIDTFQRYKEYKR